MKIVVMMSTYNGERYLEEQIQSIISQTLWKDMSLFVRDDGSTDRTPEILERYQKKGVLTYYQGSNRGPAGSFMELVVRSEDADYYAFADQDDVWDSNKIETAVRRLKKRHKPALYFANARLVDGNLKSLGRNVYKTPPKTDLYTVSCAGGLLGCTMVFNRALMDKLRLYDENDPIIMHDFFTTLVCRTNNGTVIYDKVPRMSYRIHQDNAVGVSVGLIGTIQSRIKEIMAPSYAVSIADQAKTVKKYAEPVYYTWLDTISHYKDTVFTRMELAGNTKTRYATAEQGFKLRMEILLGNR